MPRECACCGCESVSINSPFCGEHAQKQVTAQVREIKK